MIILDEILSILKPLGYNIYPFGTEKIENCINCGKCMSHCPYGLNTPELLKKNYEDYKTFFK